MNPFLTGKVALEQEDAIVKWQGCGLAHPITYVKGAFKETRSTKHAIYP
jgi:hypothetical protein